MVMIALADTFTFVLALIAVDFATWIVLPWAFYKDLKEDSENGLYPERIKGAKRALGWLRVAQGLLVASGIFFIAYSAIVLSAQNSTVAVVVQTFQNSLEIPLLGFGGFTMALGIIFSMLVVNHYVELKDTQIGFFQIIGLPLYIFEMILVGQFILLRLPLVHTYNGVQLFSFLVLVISFMVSVLGVAWSRQIFMLPIQGSKKGWAGLIFAVLPILLLALYYWLYTLGLLSFS
jgi:hypothetical protein